MQENNLLICISFNASETRIELRFPASAIYGFQRR